MWLSSAESKSQRGRAVESYQPATHSAVEGISPSFLEEESKQSSTTPITVRICSLFLLLHLSPKGHSSGTLVAVFPRVNLIRGKLMGKPLALTAACGFEATAVISHPSSYSTIYPRFLSPTACACAGLGGLVGGTTQSHISDCINPGSLSPSDLLRLWLLRLSTYH